MMTDLHVDEFAFTDVMISPTEELDWRSLWFARPSYGGLQAVEV